MTSPNELTQIREVQWPEIRIAPAVWTTCCVLAVIGLSHMLLLSQHQRNAQLADALEKQVDQLVGERNVQ